MLSEDELEDEEFEDDEFDEDEDEDEDEDDDLDLDDEAILDDDDDDEDEDVLDAGVAADELDLDDDELGEDDDDEDDDDEAQPATAAEDSDQASLDQLLEKRAARRGDDSEEEADIMALVSERDEVPDRLTVRATPIRDRQEFVCTRCHLVKPRVQLADEKRTLCRDCV